MEKTKAVTLVFTLAELEMIRRAQAKTEMFKRTEFIRQAVAELCQKVLFNNIKGTR